MKCVYVQLHARKVYVTIFFSRVIFYFIYKGLSKWPSSIFKFFLTMKLTEIFRSIPFSDAVWESDVK